MLDEWDADAASRELAGGDQRSRRRRGTACWSALERNTVVGFAAYGPAELTAGEEPDPAGPTTEVGTLLVEPAGDAAGTAAGCWPRSPTWRAPAARPAAGLAARGRPGVRRLLRVGRLGAGRLGPHAGHREATRCARSAGTRCWTTSRRPRRGHVSFEGFPDEGLVFYEGLEADNTKTYWTAHKAAYEAHVAAPLLALLEELAPEFGTAKVFRPYRDVRFSNDKTPYKTHQGAVIHPEGRGGRAWYVQISADGLRVAGGCWRLESDQVARYRRAVADDVQGPRLQSGGGAAAGGGLVDRR